MHLVQLVEMKAEVNFLTNRVKAEKTQNQMALGLVGEAVRLRKE